MTEDAIGVDSSVNGNFAEVDNTSADVVNTMVNDTANAMERIVIVEKVFVASPKAKLDMDEMRLRRNAEFYAKCLNKVREWLVECLGEENVPPAYELEENMRSGILLARLANYFAPDMVNLDKVFDLDTSRLHDQGLQYRHTDNILKWRRACQSVNVMSILLPEPVDVYSGRNIRTILALIALANRLHSLGKAPPLRDHAGFILSDADYCVIRERVVAASEIEGIDWEVVQRDHHKTSYAEMSSAEMSAVEMSSAEVQEVSDNSLNSLRQMCKVSQSDIVHTLYDADFSLESKKVRLNKLTANNKNMRTDLHEIEIDIGLLLKNLHSEKIEGSVPIESAAPDEKSTNDEVFDENNSTTGESSYDDYIQPDHLLVAKACLLKLLSENVSGDSVKEVVSSRSISELGSERSAKVEDIQKKFGMELKKLIDLKKISDDGTLNSLVDLILWDVRNEGERERVRKERMEYLDKFLENAVNKSKEMSSQIQVYKKYEEACLKNMTGGINLAKDLNKKVRKFLNRKQNSVNKRPVRLSGEKLIKKNLLCMDGETTLKKVAKYSLIITPFDVPGYFKFELLLDGEVKYTQILLFESLLRREASGQLRLPFHDPIVFDCLGLRRYLDRKYHSKFS